MNTSENRIRRAAAYLRRIPPAVSGERGNNVTFRAACKLIGFGLSADEVFELMWEWNRQCVPPWSERDLRHKISDASRKCGADPRFSEPSQAGSWTSSNGESPEEKRRRWPAFEKPTAKDLEAIAKKRRLGVAGLELAVERGLLWITSWCELRCWVVTGSSDRAAQLRRLDGHCFFKSGGSYKAHTLGGSMSSFPIGLRESGPFEKIMLVEGGPDLLAAHHYMMVEDRTDVAAVCMLGGGHRMAESALSAFNGKHVRQYPHVDAVGSKSVELWGARIESIATKFDVFSLRDLERPDGKPVNDLNDLTTLTPELVEADSELLRVTP